MPLPPSTSRPSAHTSRARCVFHALTRLACSCVTLPSSYRRVRRCAMRNMACTVPSMRAMRSCTSWNAASGAPNCWRSWMYRAVMSYTPMHAPTGCHATMMREIASTLLVSLKLSTPARRAVSGTKQRSNVMSAFCTQRSAILFSIFSALKPGVPLRTMNALTWRVSLLRAHTTVTSDHVPLPIQRLLPSIIQPPGTLVAVVWMAAASDPYAGSVSAQQPAHSSRAIGGSSSAFCCSLPSSPIVSIARYECTSRNVDMEQSTRAISTTAIADSISERPLQPLPCSPPPASRSFANPGTNWNGNSARSQKSAITGATSLTMYSRTRLRMACSSGDIMLCRLSASHASGAKDPAVVACGNALLKPGAAAAVAWRASPAPGAAVASRDGLSCAASTAKRSAAGAVDGADMVSSGVARRSAAAAAAAVAEDGVVTAAQPNVRGQGSNNSRRGPFQGG
mmetsp:Transcript_37935/g.112318  ORF Transcript_37935/g.112318 Transcript_37935/m.112318 type:complete len:453 (-) Transcript_37935:164-1522(-)